MRKLPSLAAAEDETIRIMHMAVVLSIIHHALSASLSPHVKSVE